MPGIVRGDHDVKEIRMCCSRAAHPDRRSRFCTGCGRRLLPPVTGRPGGRVVPPSPPRR
ncbi:hypothetical protein [Trujillonella humicola]|uniref:hypothetical protein n=1 Tax=Trujillonella humicola TaxID=3383699 RepID=UPI0039066068